MTDWETLKVAELKEELKTRGVPLTGLKLKQQLIDKLNELDHEASGGTAEKESGDQRDESDPDSGSSEHDAKNQQSRELTPQPKPHPLEQTSRLDVRHISLNEGGSDNGQIEGSGDEGDNEVSKKRKISAITADEVTGVERVERLPDELPAELKTEESQARGGSTPPPIEAYNEAQEEAMEQHDPFVPQESSEQAMGDAMTIDRPEDHTEDVMASMARRDSGQEADAEIETRSTTDVAGSTRVPTPEALDDQRKRKRRSITPTPDSEEVAHKKIRTGNEPSSDIEPQSDALRKVQDVTDAAQAIRDLDHSGEKAGATLAKHDHEQPIAIDEINAGKDTKATEANRPPSLKLPEVVSRSSSQSVPERETSPAIHLATRSLYIRNFKRPLNIPTLRNRISSLARPSGDDDDPLKVFYLDSVRTHAFVSFTSITAASRVRNAIHGTRFPDEPIREPLWIDFVPDEKVQAWIDQETGNTDESFGGGRGSSKKYEVVYRNHSKGIEALHQQVAAINTQSQRPDIQHSLSNRIVPQDSSASGVVASGIHPSRASFVPRSPTNSRSHRLSQPSARPSDPGHGFRALDELFSSTAAKPKLYYQLPSQAVIGDRLDMIRELRINHNEMGKSGDEGMKRYSFEKDGRAGRDEWVDKGPEFGFGKRGQERLTGYGNTYGGGGRGRGGFRGGRRGGDSWRGR